MPDSNKGTGGGSGGVSAGDVTIPQVLQINANMLVPDVTKGFAAGTLALITNATEHTDIAVFDPAQSEYGYYYWKVPKGFSATADDRAVFTFDWTTVATDDTKAVYWQLGFTEIEDASDPLVINIAATYPILDSVFDDSGGTRYLHVTAETTITNSTTWSQGAIIAFQIARLGVHGSDTSLSPAEFIKASIFYRITNV